MVSRNARYRASKAPFSSICIAMQPVPFRIRNDGFSWSNTCPYEELRMIPVSALASSEARNETILAASRSDGDRRRRALLMTTSVTYLDVTSTQSGAQLRPRVIETRSSAPRAPFVRRAQ